MKKFVIIAAACLLLVASAICAQNPVAAPRTIPAPKLPAARPVGTYQPVGADVNVYALDTTTGQLWFYQAEEGKWVERAGPIR